MLTRTSSSASSMPITIVITTLTVVKTIVRTSVCQKTGSLQDGAVVREPDVDAVVPDQLEEAVALRARA